MISVESLVRAYVIDEKSFLTCMSTLDNVLCWNLVSKCIGGCFFSS